MAPVWTVIYSIQAEKDLDALEEQIAKKIIVLLDEIAVNPYKMLEKMTNSPFYKFRVGSYRGIVNLVNNKLIVHVVKIKHRSKVYK